MDDGHNLGAVAIPRLDLLDPAVSPRAARTTVADACRNWHLGQISDTASLLVSELVTNAVRHARPPISLHITNMGARRIRVEVADCSARPPQLHRNPDTTAPGGRGLFIVDTLATIWGYKPVGNSKIVWFELAAR